MIIENLKARVAIVIFAVIMAFLYILPNFTTLPANWWFKKDKLNYGLDIQGGAHLIYGVDVDGVIVEKTARLARSLASDLKIKSINVESVRPSEDRKSIIISFSDPSEKAKVSKYLEDYYGTTLQVLDSNDKTVTTAFFETKIEEFRTQIIRQAIEVIRNRVDESASRNP